MSEEMHIDRKEEQRTSEEKTSGMTEITEKKLVGRLGKKQMGLTGAVVVIVIALLVGIGINNSPARHLTRQLELGQKYLEEMNYEEAVVAFNNVIEIDPLNADAYLGLVEVYIRTGDFETALAYAQKGYDLTGDERLKEKIGMIESGNITASNGWVMKKSQYDHGELMWHETYTYDLQGRKKTTTLCNGKGQLVGEGDNQYDEQGNTLISYGWGAYTNDDPLSVKMEKWEYQYDAEGRILSVQRYDLSGTLLQSDVHQYDAEGRLTTRKEYNGAGDLQESQEYEYDSQGRNIVEKRFDASGTLIELQEFEYDAEDREIGRKDYDSSGSLLRYYEYEYDAEGRQIGDKKYDASGNLIGEMKME